MGEQNYRLIISYDGTRFKGWQRLPGENTAVMTYRESGIEVEIHERRGWDYDEFTPCPVTHWMPLPEPPKGE